MLATMTAAADIATEPRVVPNQALIGLGLAALILGGWLGLHVYGVHVHRWTAWSWVVAPLVIAVQTWLNVGLFITAHDAMHGSLAPGRPGVNRWVGRLALFLYAGFRYDRLAQAHYAHHRAPGSAEDPDFHPDAPHAFRPWIVGFIRRYFGLFEFTVLTVAGLITVLVLGASLVNVLVFWALPAVLSAVQLFTFGTWLPHRHEREGGFVDGHNARSSNYGFWLSLLTCFHFGRHLEHHREPWRPWWRLKRTV